MSVLNRNQISSSINTNLPDNTSGEITPLKLREELINIADSVLFPQDSGSISASFASSGDGEFSGSFSGSFQGNGSQLTGITAVTAPGGSNTNIQFNDNGVTSGSINFTFDKTSNIVYLTGSLEVTGGITGSLLGTASYADASLSASYSDTSLSASYSDTSLSASYATTSLSASYADTSVSASYVESYTIPLVGYEWNTNYFNLTNGIDNNIPWDTEVFNTDTSVFELINSGTTNAVVHIKQSGNYEIISQLHFFDLFGNMDFLVKIKSGPTTGSLSTVTLLNDSKFAELSADQLINGTTIIRVNTPGYYTLAVNPSANAPFPSNSDSTPTKVFIKKIGN